MARADAPEPFVQPEPVVAQPQTEQQRTEQARVLFSEGLKFVEQEDWIQAESRFRSVLMLKSSQVVAYNLASALTHLGRFMEAAELLRAIVRDDTVEPRTRAAAQQLLAETEQQIGILTLRIVGDAQGAQVQLDGAAIELSEQILTISVDPGEHRVIVEREGRVLASQTVRVGGDAPLQVEVTLPLPPRIAPVVVARAARSPSRQRPASAAGPDEATWAAPEAELDDGSILEEWWLWAAIGTAVAGGAVAGVLIATRGTEEPVPGDTNPAVLHGTVKAP